MILILGLKGLIKRLKFYETVEKTFKIKMSILKNINFIINNGGWVYFYE